MFLTIWVIITILSLYVIFKHWNRVNTHTLLGFLIGENIVMIVLFFLFYGSFIVYIPLILIGCVTLFLLLSYH